MVAFLSMVHGIPQDAPRAINSEQRKQNEDLWEAIISKMITSIVVPYSYYSHSLIGGSFGLHGSPPLNPRNFLCGPYYGPVHLLYKNLKHGPCFIDGL